MLPISPTVLEDGNPALDARGFRRCLGQFATGIAVITTMGENGPAGLTVNSFSSLSLNPPLVIWSIARTSRSFELFSEAPSFAVNVLSSAQVDLSQRFSSSESDKFTDVNWTPGGGGAPLLEGAIATFECATESVTEGGDHVIVIGRVQRYARLPGRALLYAQGQYAVPDEHPAFRREVRTDESLPRDSASAGEPSVLTLLFRVKYLASDAFDQYRRLEGLTLAQSRILTVLGQRVGPIREEDLVRILYLSDLSAEDAIASLRDRGCVFRDGNGGIGLTAAGVELLRAIMKRFESFQDELFDDVGQPDLDTMRRVFAVLYRNLRELP